MESLPSRTALGVAMRRAAHQLFDRPLLFEDPFALPILPQESAQRLQQARDNPHSDSSRAMRAFVTMRSRFAEDELALAVEAGVRQYIVLGAGLDTFSLRNPFYSMGLQVFEVDHPATQAWKLARLKAMQAPRPNAELTAYVAVDFEHESFLQRLLKSGFAPAKATQVSWLGVIPYLTLEGFRRTLDQLGELHQGSGVVFDYGLPRDCLTEEQKKEFDILAWRVSKVGEPFQLHLTPEEMEQEWARVGWRMEQDLDVETVFQKYFAKNEDKLPTRSRAAHIALMRKI